MNKSNKSLAIFFISSLLIISFISAASASWYNPLTWFSSDPNAADEKQLQDLQNQFNVLKQQAAKPGLTNEEGLALINQMTDLQKQIDEVNTRIANRQQGQNVPAEKPKIWILRDNAYRDIVLDLFAILVASLVLFLIGTYYRYFAGEAGRQRGVVTFSGIGGFFKAFGILFLLHLLLGYVFPGYLRVLRIILWPMYFWDYKAIVDVLPISSWAQFWDFLGKLFDPTQSVLQNFTKEYIQENINIILIKGILTALWIAFGYSMVKWVIGKGEDTYGNFQQKRRGKIAKEELEDQEFREMVEKEKARILKTAYRK